MFDKLNQAKQMAEGIKAKLETISVIGEAEGIKVVSNANRKILEVNIPENLLNTNSKEELQDLLCVAINRALAAAENVSEAEMRGMMGSMMPGLGGLFK
jgi:DNA-binding protein YbaB